MIDYSEFEKFVKANKIDTVTVSICRKTLSAILIKLHYCCTLLIALESFTGSRKQNNVLGYEQA